MPIGIFSDRFVFRNKIVLKFDYAKQESVIVGQILPQRITTVVMILSLTSINP